MSPVSADSDAPFRMLADAIPQLAWMANADGYIFWYNQRWYTYTGATPAAMEGWGWQAVHDPELLPSVLDRWTEAIRSGSEFEMEFPLRRADGEFRWFLTRVTPVTDASGRVIRWFGTNTDVDELREARAEADAVRRQAERQRAALEAVLDVVPIGIGITNDPMCIDIRCNPAFAAQLGIDRTMNASKTGATADALTFVISRDGHPVPPEELPMQTAAREGVTIRDAEYEITHADGRVVRLLEYAAPLYDESGAIRGAVGAFVDVTERADLLAREREARAEAEAASRAKSEFLATMSHELRTPLNAIGGYAELMELGIQGPITDEQRIALQRIQTSQRHLLGLINEVLNYTRVEAGAVQYDLRAVSVAEALAVCEALTAPQMRAKGLTFRSESAAPDLTVLADREKLQQILLNLLSNAIKFTDGGGAVAVRCEASGDFISFAVTDTGRGIPADRLEHVFEPFVQIDARLARAHDGVGLGLAISRDLARRMHGDLTVSSTVGVGSVFRLRMPRADGLT